MTTEILQMEARRRGLAMFNLAIDSKLKGCGLGPPLIRL